MKVQNFFSELKRRRVFRVAVVYAGVAFIVFQVADFTFPALHVPDWFSSAVVVLLLLGFFIAVGMAWAFDITEQGVVRAKTKGPEEAKAAHRPLIGNKTLAIVAAVAGLGVAATASLAVWSYLSKGKQPGPINAIAVLPLENLMNDPEQEYFVDGMHEALISELGKISALRVISRTSAMHYKDTDKLLPEIARELGVNAVVEGSVLRVGDRVKITAQLMGTAPERHLWTDDYTRDLRDVLELHSEVARAIAKEIKVTLTPEEEARLAAGHPVDPAAYEAYLLGRHYYNKAQEADLRRAIEYFKQSIEIDSIYALGYSGLADAYTFLSAANIDPPEDTWPKARAAAEEALALDEGLAEAHTSLAFIKISFDLDWTGAEREFKHALEINPSSRDAHQFYAYYLSHARRHNEAIAHARNALELDPYSLLAQHTLAWLLSRAGHHDEAIHQSENIIAIDSDYPWGHWMLALAYANQEMYEEAIPPLQTSMTHLGEDVSDEIGFLGYLYGRLGRRAEARKLLKQLDERSARGRYVSPVSRSWIYIGLGDKDQAFALLEEGYETHAGWMATLKVDFFYNTIRDDPRFADLLRRMNFPE